jgi:hypothetical protein
MLECMFENVVYPITIGFAVALVVTLQFTISKISDKTMKHSMFRQVKMGRIISIWRWLK